MGYIREVYNKKEGRVKACAAPPPFEGRCCFSEHEHTFGGRKDKSVAALDEAMSGDRLVFLATQKSARVNHPLPDDIYNVGTWRRSGIW